VARDASAAGGEPARASSGNRAGAALTLTGVVPGGTEAAAVGSPGLTLRVPPGQRVALLSKPASTATALLDVVAGLRRARSGRVLIDDTEVHRLRGQELDRYRGSRGLISGRYPLLPSVSVTDNVLAALLSRRADTATRERAARMLAMTGAAGIQDGPVTSLTAEQQWRVLVARALLQSPRLVLAEDPTPSLDPHGATGVLDVLMDAHAQFGFTLLLTVDRLATASRCERLVTIVDGEVAEDVLMPADDAWTRGRIDRIG
jgi:ABC-type lipoprotein export system ATPase subunit